MLKLTNAPADEVGECEPRFVYRDNAASSIKHVWFGPSGSTNAHAAL